MDPTAPAFQVPEQGDRESKASRPRRSRRGRASTSNAALSLLPASVAPNGFRSADTQTPSSAANADHETFAEKSTMQTRGRGRGRGRGGRELPDRTVNGRQFGGQLTRRDTNQSQETNASTVLEAGPGGQGTSQTRVPSTQKQQPPRKRRLSKSQAPDIASRVHEDIDHGLYECPICTSEVRRNSKVWSCHTCWTVFHLTCIKKWSVNQGSAASRPTAEGADTPPRQWRCPGCNLPKDEVPKLYSCWCGKEIDPKPLQGIPPHSCGNTCAKERAKRCPHPCQLTCHAGPCPPCHHMGPTQMCFCGKHEVTKRCSETDYDAGWSCGELCGEVMPCGEHLCERPCHEGLCGACETRIPARCYCGQMEKNILCADRGDQRESHVQHISNDAPPLTESWMALFDCGNICGRKFDCGNHHCENQCHVQLLEEAHCPRSPDLVTHCPCGKTPLELLSDTRRDSCMDPIAHCKQPCGKVLACGHQDEQICHTGKCMPCTKSVDVKCRCGRTTSKVLCHQAQDELPRCTRVCKALLNCSRHQCDEICCPGERSATERQSSKRKQRPLGTTARPADEDFEAEHICTLQCGRPLKCGIHSCAELCHRGPCRTCREAIFEEISCHCGRTVLQPPLPCGTQPPPCRYPCTRSKACSHPQVVHNCHQEDEACPKCPYLLEKRCMCGRKAVKNQPCWLQDVRCGEVCDKVLKCGAHHCRKTCHRSGECEDADQQPCRQPCGKIKKACGHPDLENTCHAPFVCKEDKPCQSKIYITCECQAQKQEARCGASRSNEGNSGKSLPCNDECARLERNRRLAQALQIDQSTHVDGGDHIPYAMDTLDLYAEHPKWSQTQEREFRVFAASPDEKRLRFKPMQSHQRAFIHALSSDFGLDSESMDPEPNRHVMIWKTPRFVSAPNKTLAESLRLRQAARANIAAVTESEKQAQKERAAASTAPFNGFVIPNPRFGLTLDELRIEVDSLVTGNTALAFDIEFLPSEHVVLKASSRSMTAIELEHMLQNVKLQIISAIGSKGYGTPEICAVDSSLNIVRTESDNSSAEGWSKVAAKKAAPKATIAAVGPTAATNAFSALGSNKVTFQKKKPMKVKTKAEPIVDDWEAAQLAEEEKERSTGDEEDLISSTMEARPVELSTAVEDVSKSNINSDSTVQHL